MLTEIQILSIVQTGLMVNVKMRIWGNYWFKRWKGLKRLNRDLGNLKVGWFRGRLRSQI